MILVDLITELGMLQMERYNTGDGQIMMGQV